MINLDPIIGQMKQNDCRDCLCLKATSDVDEQKVVKGQTVNIHGSFCNVVPGHDQIAIVVSDEKTGQHIWSRVCDTGQMCSIPFSSAEGFNC